MFAGTDYAFDDTHRRLLQIHQVVDLTEALFD